MHHWYNGDSWVIFLLLLFFLQILGHIYCKLLIASLSIK